MASFARSSELFALSKFLNYLVVWDLTGLNAHRMLTYMDIHVIGSKNPVLRQ